MTAGTCPLRRSRRASCEPRVSRFWTTSSIASAMNILPALFRNASEGPGGPRPSRRIVRSKRGLLFQPGRREARARREFPRLFKRSGRKEPQRQRDHRENKFDSSLGTSPHDTEYFEKVAA